MTDAKKDAPDICAPWRVESDPSGGDGKYTQYEVRDCNRNFVCAVFDLTSKGERQAHLIAAAPKMYAALQEVIASDFELSEHGKLLLLDRCRAALASADPDLERALALKSEAR